MSKSLKNVVNPDDVIREYARTPSGSTRCTWGPSRRSKPWNRATSSGSTGSCSASGAWRSTRTPANCPRLSRDDATERLLHKTIRKVGDDIERLGFNTAIAAMIEFVNAAMKSG